MNYRKNPKNGEMLSVLGYGCMRFTRKGASVDQQKAEKEMLYAIENGVNYFDTAYVYPGSEAVLGKFLSKGYRKKINIATKLPHYLIKSPNDFERIFQAQKSRLQTDYIDYYLMHALSDIKEWQKLKQMGIEHWIADKKNSGQIRNIGFSFHGGSDKFIELTDDYDWDFCQIQYNYMDEYSQAGIKGLKHAASKNLAVIVMEPLRGGRLANSLPKDAKNLFINYDQNKNPAYWGLKWVMNHPEVTVVLSGMNDMAQVTENVGLAASMKPNLMSDDELDLIEKVKNIVNRKTKIACTGCGYCMPCPFGVDIPVCFKAYNTIYSDNYYTGLKEYFMCTTLKSNTSNASKCIQCGRCEKLCPQSIEIRKELHSAAKKLETPLYKIAKKATRSRFK